MKNALTAAIIALVASSAHAATITWSTVTIDSNSTAASAGTGLGDAAVSTSGTLLEAVRYGTVTDLTVNGVLFKGYTIAGGGTAPTYYSNSFNNDVAGPITGTTTGQTIDTLTSQFARRLNNSSNPGTISGLIPGQQYLVQLVSAFNGDARNSTFNDGNGNSIVTTYAAPQRFANGVFTATGETQTLNQTASSGSSFLNAYQLRALTEAPKWLRVDFNDNDSGVSPTQDYFYSVTQTGRTGMVTGIGTIDLSFNSIFTGAGDPDRDRGPVTGTAKFSDLGRDFIFNQDTTLDITLSGVEAGFYKFTAFLHDNNVDQGTTDIDFSVDGGSIFSDGAIGDFTAGALTDVLGRASFYLTADGINDLVFRFDGSNGNNVINGFILQAIPAPSALPAGAALLAATLLRRRRR